MTTLLLARHGETRHNAEGRVQGPLLDAPLTERGFEQAMALARHLAAQGVDAVYTSPLLRARETAIAIASEARVPVLGPLEGLKEFSWGELDGRVRAEIADEMAALEARWRGGDVHAAAPGGESPAQAFARAWPEVRRVAERHPGKRVVLVAHAGIGRILVAGARGDLASLGEPLPLAAAVELPLGVAPQPS